MKIIKKMPIAMPKIAKKKVAAYARVSVDNDFMNNSLMAQICYYEKAIRLNPNWEYVGVFYDDGISGTKVSKRDGFNEMMAKAKEGGIDIILTKFISRFSRNTVNLLNNVRLLKELNVEVRFEREGLSTMSTDGELILTLLGAFAEEEAQSASNNVKWAIRKKLSKGIPHGIHNVLGYSITNGEFTVIPEEAEIVRFIFDECIKGIPVDRIARCLNSLGKKGRNGSDFSKSTIKHILSNIIYTGDLLLQKQFISDDISRKLKDNEGELPQYFVENNHEPIISRETYDKAQEARKIRSEKELANREFTIPLYPFSLKIKCSKCGAYFVRVSAKNSRSFSKMVLWH